MRMNSQIDISDIVSTIRVPTLVIHRKSAKEARSSFTSPVADQDFDGECWLGLTGHEVDFAPVGLDVVDDDVAIRPPPFGAIVDLMPVQQSGRVHRAVGDAAGKIRQILAEQNVPNQRVNAIGPDDSISVSRHAVGEAEPDTAIRTLFERRQLMTKTQFAGRHRTRQGGVKVGTMRQQVWCTIALFGGLAEDHVEANFASIEVLIVPGAGIEGGHTQDRLKAEGAQDFHRITANLDAGPNPGEAPGLLIDGDIDADPAQGCRGRKTTHSRANDCYGKLFYVGMP